MATDDDELDWEPIIGHLPIAHSDGKVTYDGYVLHVNGHIYDHSVAHHLPLTTPVLTKTGRVAARQPPQPQKRPQTWWKAQCIFRGLSSKGTIAQLQDRLRGHENDPVSEDLRALEPRAKQEYKIKNNAAVEDRWKNEMSGDDKLRADARRYLTETFPVGEALPELLVIKGDSIDTKSDAMWRKALAEDLKLEAEVVEAPVNATAWSSGPSGWWTVVGRKRSAVAEEARAISRETQKFKDEKRRREDEARKLREALAKKKEQDLKEALAKCKNWDVTGTYRIRCSFIEENWGIEGGLTIKVYLEPTPKGPQMFAKFDFGVTTGVFRFERHSADVEAPPPRQDNKKRKREYDSEDEDGHDPYEERRSPTPNAFYFENILQPSSEHQVWNYRWRGEETGEGVIELSSDEKLYQVKWFGPRVETLEGTFGGGMFENCTFTGIKIGVGTELKHIKIAEEWANLNEAAYDRAASARWGRW